MGTYFVISQQKARMKIVSLLFALARAEDETPHDPEAMDFCQGKPEGFYQNVKDCQSFFFCWDNGHYGDKLYCAPGTTFHPRLLTCDWPYCLPTDNECYEPCGVCNGMTEEEIQAECATHTTPAM